VISGKKTKGMGKYQIEKAQKSIMAILRVISDEKPHQYSELKEKTKLNSPTLTKHLKRLTEMKILKKKIDIESGKYPYPVYYSTNPAVAPIITVMLLTEHEMHEIEKIILDPKKTPLDVLDQINRKNNALLLSALKHYKENKDLPQDFVDFVLEITVWHPYKVLTSHLIEESKKIVDNIDVEELQKRNDSTVILDKIALKDLGLNENEIEKFMKKYAVKESFSGV
jgi:DNA-binding transcriptional ArsR family regulator